MFELIIYPAIKFLLVLFVLLFLALAIYFICRWLDSPSRQLRETNALREWRRAEEERLVDRGFTPEDAWHEAILRSNKHLDWFKE